MARVVLALAILAGSAYFVLTKPAQLGLDLRGGTQIVLETKDAPNAKANADTTDRTLEVLRRRVDALGVSEPSLARSGDRRIIIELPGVQDPDEATEVIGRTAQLTFHPVLGIGTETGDLILENDSGERLSLGPAALTGEGVSDAQAQFDTQGGTGWHVVIEFRGDGQQAWGKLTGAAACEAVGDPKRRVAIVLDDEIITDPQVNPEVVCNVGLADGSTRITGGFDRDSATDLALLIRAGALPVPVEIIEQRTVGPSLGAAAIEASAKAAVIGVILTALFIVMVYRLAGLLAVVALGAYGLISYAALVALGATLTLPGLAGFVLAIGMAVDANVLIFERSREEYSKSLRTAVSSGFKNALSAIADSNITTLLAAALLFFLASGSVRGFGVTLSIGVLASMVSALIISRVLVETMARSRWVQKHPKVSGIAHIGRVRTWLNDKGPNLMRHRRRWIALSALVMVVLGAGMVVRGFEFGVDLTGGRLIEYSTSRPVNVDSVREAVASAGFPTAVVQESGDNEITVRAGELSDAQASEVESAIARLGGDTDVVRDERIGPSLGAELRNKALIALGVALLAQLAYLAIRFKWFFGAGAVLALLHDVVILVGIFAWLGKPIDGVFIAALLTVIGYSVNDSVVVFDRIRETWRGANRKTPFPDIANAAVLQTIPRTVNTGIGAMFILAALAFLGGDSLTDFAVALLIGVLVGTYSTVFLATPLAVEFQPHSRARITAKPKRARTSNGAVL